VPETLEYGLGSQVRWRMNRRLWRLFMKLFDPLRTLYAALGASHPVMSLIVVFLVFGTAGALLWRVGAYLNKPDQAAAVQAAPTQTPAPPPEKPEGPPVVHRHLKQPKTVEQHSSGPNSPNVNTGDGSSVVIK
jgi:hypothetical protein